MNIQNLLTDRRIANFWKKVEVGNSDDCWLWKGRRDKGYGHFDLGNSLVYAHRLSYVLANGEIPDNLFVLHTCDNRICVNPAHLWLGTLDDNNKDRNAKGRQARGEKHGKAILTQDQVLEIRRLYATKRYTQKELGTKYCVSRSAIKEIVNRINWSFLAG